MRRAQYEVKKKENDDVYGRLVRREMPCVVLKRKANGGKWESQRKYIYEEMMTYVLCEDMYVWYKIWNTNMKIDYSMIWCEEMMIFRKLREKWEGRKYDIYNEKWYNV